MDIFSQKITKSRTTTNKRKLKIASFPHKITWSWITINKDKIKQKERKSTKWLKQHAKKLAFKTLCKKTWTQNSHNPIFQNETPYELILVWKKNYFSVRIETSYELKVINVETKRKKERNKMAQKYLNFLMRSCPNWGTIHQKWAKTNNPKIAFCTNMPEGQKKNQKANCRHCFRR